MPRYAFLALGFALLAQPQKPIPGRPHTHPLGFRLRVPPDWKAENGPDGILLLPPRGKVDPDREDNPEVYTASLWEGGGTEDPRVVEDFEANFADPSISFLKRAQRSEFSAADRKGTLLLWEFQQPAKGKVHQVRVYLRSSGDKLLCIVARGLKTAIDSRDWPLRLMAASMEVPMTAPAKTQPEKKATPLSAAAPQTPPTSSPGAPASAVLGRTPPPAVAQTARPAGGSSRPNVAAAGTQASPLPDPPLIAPAKAQTAKSAAGLPSDPWTARLSGKLLRPAGGGPAIELRSDGSYQTSGESGASGKWQVRKRGNDAFLELRPASGQLSLLMLRMVGTSLLVGGVAHQIEAAP